MGIIDNEVIFGGKSTKDFGLLISGYGAYKAPARDYDIVSVKGRNGDLIYDNKRYENVDLTYKGLFYKGTKDYEDFQSYLLSKTGYQRLEDSFHPDEFRLACFKGELKPTVDGNYDMVSFSLKLNCKPEKYLKSGEQWVVFNNGGTLMNPALYKALPLIRLYNSGTLTINGTSITVNNVDGYVDIDCDIMDAYKGDVNMNGNVTGDFPALDSGANIITFTGRCDIRPRWYTI